MKIKQLIDIVNLFRPYDNATPFLYGKKDLLPLKDLILQCEEFSECTELNIVDTPVFNIDNNNKSVQTYKVFDDIKFEGKVHLLSIDLTPELYEPGEMYKPVKDGACITPIMYDPNTFLPKRTIILEFSPEMVMGEQIKGGEYKLKYELHTLLDKVLDNPDDYQIKGKRMGMVRLYMEK